MTYWRRAIFITIAAGIVRLAIGALTPLFPDETYYWDWSRHLAAGYFDHPPAIAWAIRFGTLVAGDTPIGVRLGPAIAGTIAALFLCAASRRLAGDQAGLLAAIAFAAMPLSAAGLILATPDAPLLAAAAATAYALVRVFALPPGSRESLAWWCVAGLSIGIAFWCKYTAVLLPLGVFIALVTRRDTRARLREAGPYAATAIATLVFLPVILWNARHEWISFAFQLRHGFGAAPGGSILGRELELIGGQAGLVSPILFVLIVIAIARGVRASRQVDRVLAVAALVVFAFFMYSATQRRVEANWPSVAYVPAILLLAAHPMSRAWERWLRSGVVLAGILTLVTYVNAFVPILPVPARRDPAARAAGWDDLAREVNRIYEPTLPISSRRTWVAGDRYQEASALAFHLPNHPETFSLNLSGRRNQYDLWPKLTDRAQPRDGLILVVDDTEGPHPSVVLLGAHFTAVRRESQARLARRGDVVKYLRIWVLDGWRGTWPTR